MKWKIFSRRRATKYCITAHGRLLYIVVAFSNLTF
nr:MAG TPA: hypothetical protein [Caudoviricetes sp.]